jgi:serine/threonine-protein kinase
VGLAVLLGLLAIPADGPGPSDPSGSRASDPSGVREGIADAPASAPRAADPAPATEASAAVAASGAPPPTVPSPGGAADLEGRPTVPAEAEVLAAVAPPAPVTVHINVRPFATVFIDGRELGQTPLANVPLAPGPHELRAVLPDGRELVRRIQVDASTRAIALP